MKTGRSKLLVTLNLLQCIWTLYAVIPFLSAFSSCLSTGHKMTASERNTLTKKVRVLSQLSLSPLWNTTCHSPHFKINCLCLPFAVSVKWVTDGDFGLCCMCFVLANNRLVGTSEKTCCCFRELERDDIDVLSDLKSILHIHDDQGNHCWGPKWGPEDRDEYNTWYPKI